MTCRSCGCTQYTACAVLEDFSTEYCEWVDHDLCSFCAANNGHPWPGSRIVELDLVPSGAFL